MASEFIINVTEADFEIQVLAYSQQIPVIVDFWAEWCAPCRVLGPILERITIDGQGNFRLAKLNVDENPNLATRYNVRSIPAVKAFKDGRMVSEFLGAKPEPQVREFIRAIAPNPSDLAIEKGNSLLAMKQIRNAEKVFRQVMIDMPENTQAQLGLAKSLLLQGHVEEGSLILASLPPSREYSIAELLRPLATALQQVELTYQPSLYLSEANPLDAAYQNALRLFIKGNYEAAMDGLIDILRQEKRYRNGEARQVILGMLELLGDNELTRQYRNELASVLF